MDSNYSFQNVYEVDAKDLIWKFLAQWKAVLLVCIIMALLIPGFKYLGDKKAFEAEAARKAEAEKEASIPIEERVEKMLGDIPSEDASLIRLIFQQMDLIDLQKEYLNSSIFANTDPTSQRNLYIQYQIKKSGDVDMQVLADAYISRLKGTESINALHDVIAPEASTEAINEIVDIYTGEIADSDVESVLLTVNVILPDDTNADAVIETVDSNIKTVNKELNNSVGSSNIDRFIVDDVNIYNQDVSDKRASVLESIYDLTIEINSEKTKISKESQEAAEAIFTLKTQTDEMREEIEDVSADDEPAAPAFNKKYAALGFILGGFVYVFVFLVLQIFRKTLSSAASAQKITGKRLLGEMYIAVEHKGLSGLLNSRKVNEIRYKEKLNTEAQAGTAVNTIKSVCAYHNVDVLPLLTSGESRRVEEITKTIEKGCMTGDSQVRLDIIDADTLDEKTLSNMDNAIYLLSNNTNMKNLGELLTLCKEYDVRSLGAIYMEEV